MSRRLGANPAALTFLNRPRVALKKVNLHLQEHDIFVTILKYNLSLSLFFLSTYMQPQLVLVSGCTGTGKVGDNYNKILLFSLLQFMLPFICN